MDLACSTQLDLIVGVAPPLALASMAEHNVEFVMSACDHITVFEQGQVIALGTPAEIRSDANVQRAYLGGGDVIEMMHALLNNPANLNPVKASTNDATTNNATTNDTATNDTTTNDATTNDGANGGNNATVDAP